jgi:hypothetical protein
MKYILTFLLSIFAHTSMAADKSGNIAIWGAGQKSCFSYSKARENEDDGYYKYYLMGYLTAYNTQTPDTYRLSGDKSLTDILSWLDDYCETKQVSGFDQAVIEFIVEQYPHRHKSAKSTAR